MNNKKPSSEKQPEFSGRYVPDAAPTDLKKHLWLLILVLATVLVAAILSRLIG